MFNLDSVFTERSVAAKEAWDGLIMSELFVGVLTAMDIFNRYLTAKNITKYHPFEIVQIIL